MTETIKAFITKAENNEVHFHCFELDEHRVSTDEWLFEGMDMFEGKNICIEIFIEPGTMITKIVESKDSKMIQLHNYHIKKKF